MADEEAGGRTGSRAEPVLRYLRRRLSPKRVFPVLQWLPRYGRSDLAGDLPAGLPEVPVEVEQGAKSP